MFNTAASTASTAATSPSHRRNELRYWGPARRNPEHPLHPAGSGAWDPFDPRDEAGSRPDDN